MVQDFSENHEVITKGILNLSVVQRRHILTEIGSMNTLLHMYKPGNTCFVAFFRPELMVASLTTSGWSLS